MKKAIIYCRVSTKEQVEEGNSLETQEKICREYCEKKEYELVEEPFIEKGESAKTTARPVLQEMLRFCTKNFKDLDSVVIYKLDRMSRNTDDYSQLRMFFDKLGVRIESTSEQFSKDPVGRFVENTLANVSELDNAIRTERSVNGSKELVLKGMRNGKVPIGLIKEKVQKVRHIIHEKPYCSHIKRAFELIKAGFAQEEARKQLLQEGFREKDGREVSSTHFEKILKNPIYKGWLTDYGLNVKGDFEPIVSEELFDEVQLILANKKRKLPKYNKQNSDFPLRGMLLCKCGTKLTGSTSRGHCGGFYPNYSRRCKQCDYDEGELNRNKIHLLFKSYLQQFNFNKELSTALETAIKINWDKRHEQKIKLKAQLEKKLESLSERKKIIIEKNISGVYSDELFKDQININEMEYKRTKIEYETQTNFKEEISNVVKFSLEFLQNISNFWEKADVAVQQRFQNFFFPSGLTYFGGGKFGTHQFTLVFQLKQAFSEQKYPLVALSALHPRG